MPARPSPPLRPHWQQTLESAPARRRFEGASLSPRPRRVRAPRWRSALPERDPSSLHPTLPMAEISPAGRESATRSLWAPHRGSWTGRRDRSPAFLGRLRKQATVAEPPSPNATRSLRHAPSPNGSPFARRLPSLRDTHSGQAFAEGRPEGVREGKDAGTGRLRSASCSSPELFQPVVVSPFAVIRRSGRGCAGVPGRLHCGLPAFAALDKRFAQPGFAARPGALREAQTHTLKR